MELLKSVNSFEDLSKQAWRMQLARVGQGQDARAGSKHNLDGDADDPKSPRMKKRKRVPDSEHTGDDTSRRDRWLPSMSIPVVDVAMMHEAFTSPTNSAGAGVKRGKAKVSGR